MATLRKLALPTEAFRLEERNLPADLARSLAGRTVTVRVLPEETARTRCVKLAEVKQSKIDSSEALGGYPLLVDPEGNFWNDWRPVRVLFTDTEGREWRLPRRWLPELPQSSEPPLDAFYNVSDEIVFTETMYPPTQWDLWEVNVPWEDVFRAYGRGPWTVEVRLAPGEPVKVFWRSQNGTVWRLPHDWRRRQVKLPEHSVLVSQGIPDDVAEECAGRIVSVNYHPGSLCCLPGQYRCPDGDGHKWPVRIRDCTLVGFGDAAEHLA